MKTKAYNYRGITFQYSVFFKKWQFFLSPSHCLLLGCHGREQAFKAARILAGSVARSAQLDNLARANLAQLGLR